ncbi:hypothetical protein ACQP1G_12835 [Nocardia sp. CA-107356]|uniref:hypothetical protein n=1 Tax=Nocardia sp. CA-107356 TaxID=3239972 RepID=UPI003D906974
MMHLIAACCGFVGAWLLVAGPVYQGVVELGELGFDASAIRAQEEAIPRRRVSPWWWLLPPVAYVLTRRTQKAWQQQMMASLTPPQRAELVTYFGKAAGWFVVGGGASLIGIKEAIELVHALDWPGLITIPLVVLAAAIALAFTVFRVRLTERALHVEDETG